MVAVGREEVTVPDAKVGGVVGKRPGDQHPAIGFKRFTDCLQRFGFRAINETARVHDDQVGPFIVRADLIAINA